MRTAMIACLTLVCLAGFNPGRSQDKEKIPTIKLRVEPSDWGASPDDIAAVCRSASKELLQHFPGRKLDPIVVRTTKGPPMAVFGKNDKGERRVLLPARGPYWSQFAYQYSHELCHILCNYREAKNPNIWFEESFCEAASIYAIRQMSKSWKTSPPYPNWKSYSGSLDQYVTDHVRITRGLEGDTVAQWFVKNEKALPSFDRARFQTVAVHVLLPHLEKNPSHWRAVESLNQFDPTKALTFQEYLADWHRRVPEKHRSFVADIGKEFGVTIEERK